MAELANQVAVVTGASSGIGEAIAVALEARGYVVARVSRRSDRWPCDVSDPESVDQLKAAVEAELGQPVSGSLTPAPLLLGLCCSPRCVGASGNWQQYSPPQENAAARRRSSTRTHHPTHSAETLTR